MVDKNYALEWYTYGLEKEDDSIVKFMMHWIAFNWLYSECRLSKETDNIIKYCRENYERLRNFDAFSTEAIQIFLEGPVHDEARGYSRRGRYNSLIYDRGEDQLVSLMLTIYQVRCNLFHGSKSLLVERDVNLVRASSILLEGYLKALLIKRER